MAIFDGTPGPDTYPGTPENDVVNGHGGNDSLQGADGDDTVNGGAGDDQINTGNGHDRLDGGPGNDTLAGGDFGNDTFIGGPGVDLFLDNRGTNTVSYASSPAGIVVVYPTGPNPGQHGTASDGFGSTDVITFAVMDILIGSPLADRITLSPIFTAPWGEAFDYDEVDAGAGNDTVVGLDGGAEIDGGEGNDSLAGGGGVFDFIHVSGSIVDLLEGGPGNDTLDGSGGFSFAAYGKAPAAVRFELFAATAQDGTGGIDTLVNIRGASGSQFADILIGDDSTNAFLGGAGDDTIDGRGGLDSVVYREGGAVLVDLALGIATSSSEGNDLLIGIERVIGSDFADTLFGGAADDLFNGDEGDDAIHGGAGADTLLPGPGSDTIDGGAGPDILELLGPRSAYTVTMVNATKARFVALTLEQDVVASRVETVRFSDADRPFSDYATGPTEGADLLDGDDRGGDLHSGLGGDDSVFGRGANDTLSGNAGSDRLDGGAGDDRIDGGPGDHDWLLGGDGNDTLDGGERGSSGAYNIDIARYVGSQPLTLNLATGVATQAGFTDALSRINAVFAGDGSDSLRGLDGAPAQRGETIRGGVGDDTVSGGDGVDVAEFVGRRADYTVRRIGETTTWTVKDNNPADGDEGTDTLIGVERFIFADEMLAFGTRAEELARVACVLWTRDIMSYPALFSIGYSYYDPGGYSFDEMSMAALGWWSHLSDRALVERLVSASGTLKTEEQLIATIQAHGGGPVGRAAAIREAADDPAMLAFMAAHPMRENGIVSINFVPTWGQLFDLLPGPG